MENIIVPIGCFPSVNLKIQLYILFIITVNVYLAALGLNCRRTISLQYTLQHRLNLLHLLHLHNYIVTPLAAPATFALLYLQYLQRLCNNLHHQQQRLH